MTGMTTCPCAPQVCVGIAGRAAQVSELISTILFVQQRLAHRVVVFDFGLEEHQVLRVRDLPSVQVRALDAARPDGGGGIRGNTPGV